MLGLQSFDLSSSVTIYNKLFCIVSDKLEL